MLPSVAQPPLPLQEFLALQPWSPVLQPPWPLQPFLPAQACVVELLSAIEPLGVNWVPKPWVVAATRRAVVPVMSPAIAAPARSTLCVFIIAVCVVWFFVRAGYPAALEDSLEAADDGQNL